MQLSNWLNVGRTFREGHLVIVCVIVHTYKNSYCRYGFILYVCAIEGIKEIILDSGAVDIT